jgi:hypothetical protein
VTKLRPIGTEHAHHRPHLCHHRKARKREAKAVLQGLTQPNGLAFKDGSLYVFAIAQFTASR